jgi:hypothetical protein
MRRFGLPQPYLQLKKFTRDEPMTRELMQGFKALSVTRKKTIDEKLIGRQESKCYHSCIQTAFRSAGMTTMSIRGLDDQVLAQLKNQALREGSSLNSLVLRLLQGANKPAPAHALQKFDDLDALAGTWSDDDAAAFAHHMAAFSDIDPAQWH